MVRLAALLALVLWSLAATAKEAAPATEDPVLEARMMRIAAELRCLVCQNQTIADSHADLAQDLRQQVRVQLREGRSEAEILRYMTDRYGDFVLYRPPVKASTVLLWFGPALLLAGGLAMLLVVLRRRARLADDQFEPDEDEPADEGRQR
jgi:cytochrome c-type biogenesis protein CcmH